MKHRLGVMDLYPISANKTVIENNPFFSGQAEGGGERRTLTYSSKAIPG